MDQPKIASKKDILTRLLDNPNSLNTPSDQGVKDITGTAFGVGSMASTPKRYADIAKKLDWDPNSMTSADMEREGYLNQSGLQVFGNTIKGFGQQALSGAIDSVAAWDMEGMYDMASGNTEKQYGNWLNEIGASIRGDESSNPIFQDGDNMWNTAYWGKQVQSLGYTGGIIGEMILEQMALAYLTGGTGNAAGLASKARLLNTAKQGAFGMWKGVQEGYMNGLETAKAVEEKYRALGYSEEEVKKKASEAATLGFRAEVGPLAALNALQFMATFGAPKTSFTQNAGMNLGFSGAADTLLSRALPNVSNKFAKGAINAAANSVSESIEEGIQTGVSKYAQHTIDKQSGESVDELQLWDSEMRDSMIGGALGGTVFAGVGSLYNKLTKNTAMKEYSKAHDRFVSEASGRTSAAFQQQAKLQNDLAVAEQAYSTNRNKETESNLQNARQSVKEAQYNTHLANTVNALQLDYITGKSTGFESHIEQMQNILNAVETQNIDVLKQYNILDAESKEKFPGAIDTIKSSFEQNIKDSEKIKSILDNNLLHVTSDFESAYDITKKEYMNSKNLEDISRFNSALNTLYTGDTQFNQLSPEAQKRFKLEIENESLDISENLTQEEIARRDELASELADSPAYSTIDKRVVDSINVNPYISAYTSINSINKATDDNNRQLAKLRDSSAIQSKILARNKKKIEKAKSREEVDQVVSEAQAQGLATTEVATKAAQKKGQIAAIEAIQQTNPAFQPNTTEEPVESSKPDSTEAESLETSEKFLSLFSSGILSNASGSGEQAFTPRDIATTTPEQEAELVVLGNNYFNKLQSQFSRPLTFDDVIKDRIESTSFDNAEKTFKAYEKIWNLTGRVADPSVYDKYFNTDNLFEQAAQGILSTEEVITQNESIATNAIVDNSVTTKFDKDNRPVDKAGNYSQDGRTSNPTPKAAHLGIQYNEIVLEDGRVVRKPVLAQLNQSEQIATHNILDSDLVKEGTTLEVRIPSPTEMENMKVANWSYNESERRLVKSEISFGDWTKLRNVSYDSAEFYNKVPMIATLNGVDTFFLHDTEWYNSNNIAGITPEDQRENIRKGIEELSNLRKNIIAGNNKITVSQRNFGSLFKLNDLAQNNDPVSLSEATGETTLAVATGYNDLSDFNSSNGSLSSRISLVNNLDKNKFDIGQLYEIRQVNTLADGTKQYLALKTLTNNVQNSEPINDIAYNNIKFGIMSSIILNNSGNPELLQEMETRYGMTLSKAKDIQASIKSTTRMDIQFDMGDYMDMFVNVEKFNSKLIEKLENNRDVNAQGQLKYPVDTNYIAFDRGILKVYTKDGNPVPRNSKGQDAINGIYLAGTVKPENAKYFYHFIDSFFAGNEGNFRKTHFDVSKKQLGRNNGFVKVSDNGTLTPYTDNKHGENTYEGYIKDTVKTNIQSFPIQTESGTKWITDVQPMVYINLAQESVVSENVGVSEDLMLATPQEEVTETIPNVEDSLASIPEELRAQILGLGLDKLGVTDSIDYSTRRDISTQSSVLDTLQSNLISSLNPFEQKKISNSLFNLILADTRINNGAVNLADVARRINSSLETYLQPKINVLKDTVTNLEALNSADSGIKTIITNTNAHITKLETVITEKDKLVSNGISTPKGDLVIKFERFLAEELTGSEDIETNEDGEVEFSYNMSALEKDVKLTFSNNLKIFFANIKKQRPNTREDVINFAYLNDYESVDDVIQALTEVMVGLPSSVEELKAVLQTKNSNPIYNQILSKIESSSEEIQNEILYKMIQSKLDMHMVLYSYNRESKTYSLKIINPNSSSSDIRMNQQFQANFRASDLFRNIDENRAYNKAVVNSVISKIDKLANQKDIKAEDAFNVKEVLVDLGIQVSDNTILALIERDGKNITSASGVLGVFKNTLKDIMSRNVNVENITLDDDANNPYENAKGVLDNLIDIEIELNGTRVSKSFRVGGKSIQGAIQKMMVYDVKEKLKDTSSAYFQALKQMPLSKRNYILELLESNQKFKDNYDIGFISLEAIKQNKQKVYDDRKINKLATTDNMLTQYAFFQNKLRDLEVNLPTLGNLKFRMGQMFNSSLSDKEQMVLYSTALLDLDYKDFTFDNDIIEVSAEVVDFVTEQLYSSEFDRIVSTYLNPTNIKNYDGAAKRFLSIPELNNIESTTGSDIHSAIRQAVNGTNVDFDALRESFKPQARNIIREAIKADVLSKIDTANNTGSWYENGFINRDDKGDLEINFFDSKYLNSKKGNNKTLATDKTAQIAAYDFVVNQFLNQNNVYQLVAGDMALYAPAIKKFTKDGVVNNVAFSKAIGESITKRMAMLIAPGNKLANSAGDKYLQIFINDPIKMTSTGREFIKQYYGSVSQENSTMLDRLNQVENSIRDLYNSRRSSENFDQRLSEIEDVRAGILKDLGNNNPEIAGYFNIEGTDAQEYTTWKEHMDILFRQGRLTFEERNLLKSAYGKLERGEDLNNAELAVVMNPIKPVSAGSVIFRDKNGTPNVNRVVYIKSSSFPLLPQLTRDFKLDKIRQQMESLQNTRNQNVRLSYQTANKVGAVNTGLTVNDMYNIPFEDLYTVDENGIAKGKLAASVLEIDRDNFKIQQDTPYKTAKFLKKNSEDMTTMGSQMWKIILGNGINKIDSKIFPHLFGEDVVTVINRQLALDNEELIEPVDGMVSGKDLDKLKFHIERMYFDIQKQVLYEELGLDPQTRKPIDTNETIKLLHDLLQREVTTRQYPDNIVDALELTYTKDELEFMLPLWLSNGSNKFESLLQAIITNRLIQINLPGNQHISSSSEGFEKVAFEDLDQSIKSQVVWVNPEHTGELKATIIDGKIRESEVLLQSKFRKTYMVDGVKKTSLIDLTKAPYSSIQNGVLVLDLNMIDDELLSSFSFRIPTSSHQSGAILKVVGFLPEASGDMLVVPKEHTQQIGEDFDIDKRTLYKSNYNIESTGKISKINYVDSENDTQKKIKMLENGMVDIYKSVYMSPSVEIQKRINKILSFDNATDTANLINTRVNSAGFDKYFTIYSDDYQRDQMKLGADGKTGIGAHSNAVTFQAQMERLANKLIMQDPIYDDEGEIIGYTPREIVIGSQRSRSTGVLGNVETIDGERNIGDVHTENQNSATDNIKAQIMGKRNENSYTMNILTQMTYRGFDMVPFTSRTPEQPNSVQMPSLFISQPILRRYVELKEQNKSITAEFDANVDNTILEKLVEEFGDGVAIERNKEGKLVKNRLLSQIDGITADAKMTGDGLYDNLINQPGLKTWDSLTQIGVLQKFFQLEDEAKALGKYQSLINLSTSGLGISYFNVLDRITALNDMGAEQQIANVRDLVGDFIHWDSPENLGAEVLIPQGYVFLGDYFVRPRTTEGTVLVQSLSAATDVMDISFPYRNSVITDVIQDVIDNKGKDLSKKQKTDLQYKITGSLRDFLYADQTVGLFHGDVNTERFRLFFDKNGNQSLATYMKKLKDSRKYPIMYSNELLKSLVFDGVKSDGSPSIIKHQTDFNNNFDKTDKYNSFLELLQDDKTDLGMYNSETMTPRKLAQDLATYAYLSNNENGAIGFRDFVHMKYLDIVGVSANIRDTDKNRNGKGYAANIEVFKKQFYQHNPEEAKIFSNINTNVGDFVMINKEANDERNKLTSLKTNKDVDAHKMSFFSKLTEFTLKENDYEFIAIRDTNIKLSDNQYKLFQWDGLKYIQIPVLGTFGFSEYNPNSANQRSLIYPTTGMDIVARNVIESYPSDTVDLTTVLDLSNGVTSLLEQIYTSENPKYRAFAEQLLPFIDPTTKVVVSADAGTQVPFDMGFYRAQENTIYLHPDLIKNASYKLSNNETPMQVVEEVLLEEIIHSITVGQLNKFGITDSQGNYVPNADAPVFISKLSKLFEIAKQNLPNAYYTKDIYEFVAGSFVSDEFREQLDTIKQGNKTLFQLFKEALAGMLRYVKGTTYTDETVNSVYELLDYTKYAPQASTSVNPIEAMKMQDAQVELEISNAEGNSRASLSTGINIKTQTEYNSINSDLFIQAFDSGQELIISPTAKRSNPVERQYMSDIIAHVNETKSPEQSLTDAVIITNIDDETQTLKKRPSLGSLLSSGAFTSGGDNYSSRDRLPEIKKCK